MNKQAHFSTDGKHRFWLLRSWEANSRMIVLIGLNPSTADAKDDDQTISSIIRITKHNGFGGFVMCNLFTFITSEPQILLANMHDANREESNDTLRRMIKNTHKTICCWGNFHFVDNRVKEVIAMIQEPYCLGTNKNGSPKHPLYLPSTTLIIPYKK